MSPMTQPEDMFEALDRAYRNVRHHVQATTTGQHHFDAATRLLRQLESYVGQAAEERAVGAGRIWAEEELTLVELGRRTGVGKSRAGEWIDTYRENRRDKEETR